MAKHMRLFFLAGMAALLLLAGCGNQQQNQPSGQTITGKLVDTCGQPVAYHTVFVPGGDPVLTDENGNFTIENVQTPYDLVVTGAYLNRTVRNPSNMVVFTGLSRTDPYITVNTTSRSSSCASAQIHGNITPALPADTEQAVAAMMSPYVSHTYPGDTYDIDLNFNPDLSGTAQLLALRWSTDADGNAASFSGAKVVNLTLHDGDDKTQDVALDTTGLGTRTINVSLQKPSYMTTDDVSHYVTYNDSSTGIVTGSFIKRDADQSALSFKAPTGLGLSSLITATLTYGEGAGLESLGAKPAAAAPADMASQRGRVTVWQQVAAGTDDASVSLSLPDPVMTISPAPGTVIKPSETTFSWTGPEGALYDVTFIIWPSLDMPPRSIEVVTTGNTLKIPSFTGISEVPASNGFVEWLITAAAGSDLPATVDDYASADAANAIIESLLTHTFPGQSGYVFQIEAGGFILPDTQGYW